MTRRTETVKRMIEDRTEVRVCDRCKLSEKDFAEMSLIRAWYEVANPRDLLRRGLWDFCSAQCASRFFKKWSEEHETEMNVPWPEVK